MTELASCHTQGTMFINYAKLSKTLSKGFTRLSDGVLLRHGGEVMEMEFPAYIDVAQFQQRVQALTERVRRDDVTASEKDVLERMERLNALVQQPHLDFDALYRFCIGFAYLLTDMSTVIDGRERYYLVLPTPEAILMLIWDVKIVYHMSIVLTRIEHLQQQAGLPHQETLRRLQVCIMALRSHTTADAHVPEDILLATRQEIVRITEGKYSLWHEILGDEFDILYPLSARWR